MVSCYNTQTIPQLTLLLAACIGWKGYLWGAISTVLVGGMAAGAAFGIVRVLERVE